MTSALSPWADIRGWSCHGRLPRPSVVGSLHVHDDDHVDLDPHESDMLNAAVDFDDYGNELDFSDPISDGDEDPDWRETCS